MKEVDLSGKRFGRQIAIKRTGYNKWGNALWNCKCDCGREHIVPQGKLVRGKSKSCGCYALEVRTKSLQKHGITTSGKPRTFIIWCGMKARCNDPKNIGYKYYGARGIKICDEWMIFENFHKWALSNGYKAGLTLDRIDNNKGYSALNCKWSTPRENKIRQRKSTLIEVNGLVNSITGWSKLLLIGRWKLMNYYRTFGLDMTANLIKEELNKK